MASLQREKRKACRQGYPNDQVWACATPEELHELMKQGKKNEGKK